MFSEDVEGSSNNISVVEGKKCTTGSSILKNSEGHAQHKGNVEIGEVVNEMSSSTAIRVMERQLPR